MTAPPMSATTAAAIPPRCGGEAQAHKAAVDGSNQAKISDAAADNHVFKEPVMKEKLKYLRYFRLVTHRKKNGKFMTCSDIGCNIFGLRLRKSHGGIVRPKFSEASSQI